MQKNGYSNIIIQSYFEIVQSRTKNATDAPRPPPPWGALPPVSPPPEKPPFIAISPQAPAIYFIAEPCGEIARGRAEKQR